MLIGSLLLLSACAAQSAESAPIPTLMVLPSVTATREFVATVVAPPSASPTSTSVQPVQERSASNTPEFTQVGTIVIAGLPVNATGVGTLPPSFEESSEANSPDQPFQREGLTNATVTLIGTINADTSAVTLRPGSSNAVLVSEPEGEVVELSLPPGIAETLDGQQVEVSGTVIISPDASIPIQRAEHLVLSVISITVISASGTRTPVLYPPEVAGIGSNLPSRIAVDASSTALQVHDTLLSFIRSDVPNLDWVYLSGNHDIGWSSGFRNVSTNTTGAYHVATDGTLTYNAGPPLFLIDQVDHLVSLDRSQVVIDSLQVLQIATANGLNTELTTPTMVLMNRGDGPYWYVQSPLLENDIVIDARNGQVK